MAVERGKKPTTPLPTEPVVEPVVKTAGISRPAPKAKPEPVEEDPLKDGKAPAPRLELYYQPKCPDLGIDDATIVPRPGPEHLVAIVDPTQLSQLMMAQNIFRNMVALALLNPTSTSHDFEIHSTPYKKKYRNIATAFVRDLTEEINRHKDLLKEYGLVAIIVAEPTRLVMAIVRDKKKKD